MKNIANHPSILQQLPVWKEAGQVDSETLLDALPLEEFQDDNLSIMEALLALLEQHEIVFVEEGIPCEQNSDNENAKVQSEWSDLEKPLPPHRSRRTNVTKLPMDADDDSVRSYLRRMGS